MFRDYLHKRLINLFRILKCRNVMGTNLFLCNCKEAAGIFIDFFAGRDLSWNVITAQKYVPGYTNRPIRYRYTNPQPTSRMSDTYIGKADIFSLDGNCALLNCGNLKYGKTAKVLRIIYIIVVFKTDTDRTIYKQGYVHCEDNLKNRLSFTFISIHS